MAIPTSLNRQEAARLRADALMHVRQLADTDPANALPWLTAQALTTPAIMRLRLWRIDQALFGTSRRTSLQTVKRMLEWTNSRPREPGVITLAWILDPRSNGSRYAAWLMLMAVRTRTPPTPNPYDFEQEDSQ